MGCCLFAALLAIGPRFVLFLMWIFTTLVDRAFNGFLLPLLGLVFLPWTTLFYVCAYQPVNGVTGIGWFFVAFGFFCDISSYAGGGRAQRQRAQTA